MSTCPRCGSGLLPTATICTTCCQMVEGSYTELARAVFDMPRTVVEADPLETSHTDPLTDDRDSGDDDASRLHTGARGIPTQRGAAFHPLRISTVAPPPNPYLAADRRLYARLREAVAEASRKPADG